jgi:catechol 2,3-dioxygenase-like lactoylglutathione lyase family enzyme
MTGPALCLLGISLNVGELPKTLAFYRDALGFAIVAEEKAGRNWAQPMVSDGARVRTARLRLGRQELELVQFDPAGAPYPVDSTAADLWFQHCAIVTNDMAAAYRRLERHGAKPITSGEPQRLPAAAGAVMAYKFRDPDGHPLELIQFPPGAGDPAWQGIAGGIDHSALSVGEAEPSVAFYGRLGLGVRSRQINSGAEQDRLDGLTKVTVEVIGLSPEAVQTPHVELLCYAAPRGRRRDPGGRASDIADSRLIFEVEGLHAAFVRDPDGHASVLLESKQFG